MSRYQTPYLQYFDGNGDPLAGGFLYFYEAGTSDLKDIYSDGDLTIPASNPVTLNANGSVSNIFYSGLSRVRLTDSNGIQIFDIDNVGPEDLAGLPPLWVNDSTYSVNDVVKTADGLYYRSIQNGNAGNTPSVSSAYWEKVDYIYTYNANTTYRIDDVVKHGGKLWYSVIDTNAGNTPGVSNNWRALATGAEFDYLDGGLTQNKYAYPVGTKVLVKMYNSTTQGMSSYWIAQATTGPVSQLPLTRQDLQCTDALGRVWKLDHNGTVKISTIGGNESADNGSVFRAFADDADYLDLEGKTWPCSSLNTDDAGNRSILNNKVVNGKLVLTNSLSGETNAQTFAPYLDSELQLSQSKSPIITWDGLSVLWLGTSIPHQGAGADSYPERLADALNFTVQNYAWSGSHAFYDVDGDAFDSGTIRALSMTEADRLAGLATYGSSSAYDDSFDIVTKASQMTTEYRIKNQFVSGAIDAVVLDHNHNDRKNVANYTANDKTITGVTKGTSTVFTVADATGLNEGDGCYVRVTGIGDLDYAAGRITGVSGLNVTVAIDSSSMTGTFSTGTLKWVDRNTIKGAFDFLIAYTKNMFIQYGSADGKIILCGAPSYFTNDVDRDHSIWSSNRVIKEIADEWGLAFFDVAHALELTYQDQLTYLPDAVHPSTPETREVFTNVWFKWLRGGAGNYYNADKVLQRNKVIANEHDQPALYSKYDSAYAPRDVIYNENTPLIDDDFDPGYGSWTAAGTGTPSVVSAPWGSGNAVQFDVTVSNTAPYLQQSASVGNYPVLEFDFYMPDVDVATDVTQQCTIASINSGSGEGYSVGIIQSVGGATSLRVTYNKDGYGTAPVATLPNGRYTIESATKYRVKVDVIDGYIQFTVDGNVVYAGALSNSLLTNNTLVLVGPTFSNMDSAFSVFIGNVVAAKKEAPSNRTWNSLQKTDEQFATTAEMQASTTTIDGQRGVNQERANAVYLFSTTAVAQPGDVTAVNGVWVLQVDASTTVYNFGTSADWDSAFQDHIDRMQAETLPINIKGCDITLTSGVTLSGVVPIIGEMATTFIRCTDFVGSLITIAINTNANGTTGINGVTFVANYTGAQTASTAIEFTGNNTTFMQYCDFDHIHFRGFQTGFKNTKTARVTGFGLENNCSWNTYSNIKSTGTTHPVLTVYDFTTGSGTGNGFTNHRCQVNNTGGTVFSFSGSGHVVGDLLFNGAHCSANGASTDSSLIKVGDDTVYRQNVSFVDCQVDSNLLYPFNLSSVGSTAYEDWKWISNNTGGGTDFATTMPLFKGSLINDRQVSEYRVANRASSLPSGAQTIDVADLELADFTGCKVEIVYTGLLAGSSSFVITEKWHIRASSGSLTIANISSDDSPPGVAAGISVASSGNVATISATLTPPSTGSSIDVQISAVGGHFKLSRL